MTCCAMAELGRFVVRDFYAWEGPALFTMTGDPDVTRYMGFRTHETVDEAAQTLARYLTGPAKWQAICDAGNAADVLGVVGFEVWGHQVTMTLMFRRDKKARGAGREFGLPFVTWIFTHPQIWRLWSFVHVDNVAGQRVTERIGAAREGLMRRYDYFPNLSDEPQDCYLYAITK